MRHQPTPAEKRLWKILRNRNTLGLKFRRQHPISFFIADFYCYKYKLIIELDGPIHNTSRQKEYDESRDELLSQLGLTIMRFKNETIFSDPDTIESVIKQHVQQFKKNNL